MDLVESTVAECKALSMAGPLADNLQLGQLNVPSTGANTKDCDHSIHCVLPRCL